MSSGLAMLMGVLQQTPHLSTIWRRLYLEEIGTFAPVQVTYEAVRKRLLSAGTTALQHLYRRAARQRVTAGDDARTPSPTVSSHASILARLRP